MLHTMLWILLSFTIIGNSFAGCPTNLNEVCSCEDYETGFVVTCQKLGSDLNTLILTMEKLRVDRLTIIDASWPVLKKLSRITVRSLSIVRCGISEIETNAFASVASTLEELVLVNNSLTEFPALGNLPKLRLLNLNHNNLQRIPNNALDGISKLNQLRLEGNRFSALPSSIFNSVSKALELLDLSSNSFTEIPVEALSAVKNLKYLDLSHNTIGVIRHKDFQNLRKLIEIRLNGNMLTNIEKHAFDGVSQLQYLYLQRNSLVQLKSLQFIDSLNKLELLDLSDNSLNMAPMLRNHRSIRQIKLDGNKISSLQSHAFSGNPRLQLLSLQNNEIKSLADGCFHGLDHLTILLLENNSIRKLDKAMLSGIRKLQQLNLRNNSLNELENNTFQFVSELKMIDLAYNGLHRIPQNLLSPLRHVIWLDLSYNFLSSFEEGTFRSRIPHIILVGNPLECDSKMDWFVAYLIRNQVRTHLPLHPEVSCTSPKKYAGVRLQDLITKKAEDTLNAVGKTFNPQPERSQQDLLSNLIPSGLSRLIPGFTPPPPPNPVADVPVIGGIAEAVPAIRNIPGLSFIPKPHGVQAEEARSLNSAIEQFSTPLLRITSGDSLLLAEDLDQMVKAVPKLALAPRVDITQLPADVVARVYRGETIPGISKEATEHSLKEHVLRVYESAAAISKGKSLLDQPNHLLVLNSVPEEIVADIVKGAKLPHLTDEQTKVVKEYFDVRQPSGMPENSETITGIKFSPELFKMLKFLPANYDLNKIPKNLIESISKGELPDPNSLPEDLRLHFVSNFEELFKKFAKGMQYEEIISKLPKFDRVAVTTFIPYTQDLRERKSMANKSENASYLHLIIAGVLCGVSAISVFVIAVLYYRKRRKLGNSLEEKDLRKLRKGFLISTPQRVGPGHG